MKSILINVILIGSLFTNAIGQINTRNLSLDKFQQIIKSEMDYDALVKHFGEPEKSLGSDNHIYVYILSDSTEIRIGYSDKIMYVRNVDMEQNLLHVLFENSYRKFTYAYFIKNLNQEMDFNAIVEKFGIPAEDGGSGIYIYVYPLNDSTEIIIGYAGRILYARHCDKEKILGGITFKYSENGQ